MIKMISWLILLLKREKNWKERTSEAPKAFRSSGDTQVHMKQRDEIGTN